MAEILLEQEFVRNRFSYKYMNEFFNRTIIFKKGFKSTFLFK